MCTKSSLIIMDFQNFALLLSIKMFNMYTYDSTMREMIFHTRKYLWWFLWLLYFIWLAPLLMHTCYMVSL
jgi:hypothetical protein